MADVRWQVYWVTFVCVGGYAVIIACCRLCSPSVSVWFPQIHCRRVCFVMSVPLEFVSPQLSASDVIIWFCVVGSVFRASINRDRRDVVYRVCAAGCVGVVCRDGWDVWGVFTCDIPGDVLVVLSLSILKVLAGKTGNSFDALSSGAMCIVVSLI